MNTLVLKVFSILFISFSVVYAQKDFNGTVTYTFSVEGPNAVSVTEQMPKNQTFMVLGSKARMASVDKSDNELDAMIFDLQADKKYSIFSLDKAYQEIPAPADHELANLKTERTTEKMSILGYNCFKYTITDLTMPDTKIFVWSTEDFKIPNQTAKCSPLAQYKDIKGIPLKQQFTEGELTFTITASKVDLTKPKAELFELPKDFKNIPYQQENHEGHDHDHGGHDHQHGDHSHD